MLYLYLKAFHIIAVIAWMAGMLYLPRLFVYHCDAPKGSQQSETFKVMERRLLKAIINPAMIVSWILGLYLAWEAEFFTSPWFHAKLFFALLMTAVHGCYVSWWRAFAEDRNVHSGVFFRVINEVPTVFMIFIVILVVVKPW